LKHNAEFAMQFACTYAETDQKFDFKRYPIGRWKQEARTIELIVGEFGFGCTGAQAREIAISSERVSERELRPLLESEVDFKLFTIPGGCCLHS
jgi:hypothetical protein